MLTGPVKLAAPTLVTRTANTGSLLLCASLPPAAAQDTASVRISLEDAHKAAAVPVRMPSGKVLSVKLPEKVEEGQQIRLKGQGTVNPYGEPGDALVTVRFEKSKTLLKLRELQSFTKPSVKRRGEVLKAIYKQNIASGKIDA